MFNRYVIYSRYVRHLWLVPPYQGFQVLLNIIHDLSRTSCLRGVFILCEGSCRPSPNLPKVNELRPKTHKIARWCFLFLPLYREMIQFD